MLNQPTQSSLVCVFQDSKCNELNMIEENVIMFCFNKETPKTPSTPSTQQTQI
jgi:hypothetical protein